MEDEKGTVDNDQDQDDDLKISDDEIRLYGLEDLSEEERKVVYPHAKRIGGNFDKLQQKTAEKYKPYEELGDIAEVNKKILIANKLIENPKSVFEAMGIGTDDVDDEYADESDKPIVDDKLEKLSNDVKNINDYVSERKAKEALEEEQSKQEKARKEVADNLKRLHDEHPDDDFDDRLVSAYTFAHGGDWNKGYSEFVKARDKSIQDRIDKASEGPTVAGGPGTPPAPEPKKLETLKDAKAAALERLEHME